MGGHSPKGGLGEDMQGPRSKLKCKTSERAQNTRGHAQTRDGAILATSSNGSSVAVRVAQAKQGGQHPNGGAGQQGFMSVVIRWQYHFGRELGGSWAEAEQELGTSWRGLGRSWVGIAQELGRSWSWTGAGLELGRSWAGAGRRKG